MAAKKKLAEGEVTIPPLLPEEESMNTSIMKAVIAQGGTVEQSIITFCELLGAAIGQATEDPVMRAIGQQIMNEADSFAHAVVSIPQS